ncbi:Tyrosine-protein phosphatase 1 [Portunus trituberculatus]|uniref:Tyrosine-protein phosphatase 1 n=1 Tax=Portunus trituberculatus TaxID=210409 RepID=A0A5B7CV89_PORTR|nr:Tyrosine-protein phosphatase 1 [Portunus trituberculatus]
MLETEVMSHYGLPPSIVPDHIETIDLDIFNFHTMEKEAGIVPQQPRQDKSPDLRAEGVAKYAPPLEDVPDLLQDHLDALKLLHTRREKGELQLRDILVSGGFPGVDKDFITKAEETLLQDFFVENTEQKDNVSQCSQDTDGRSTRQPPRECRCQQEERKDGEQKTSVSVSVPCNGQDHQINVSVSHGTAKAERQEGQLLQKTHECRCGASAEAGKEISVKVEVNEGKAKMTQETNISVTSAVTSQHTSDPLKRQDLGKETKEPLQHEQHLHAPEAPGSVELVEKKHKLGIVKKLLHHKQRMFSQVVPRYEADRRLSRLEEIFFSKDSVLGQKKTRDPNTWKKKLRRVCAVYVPDDLEEPPFQYIPEVLSASATIKGGVPPLQESLMLLAEGLEAGSLVAQFEQLYRRKPGLTVTEARRQDNEKKNRYRDISPYYFPVLPQLSCHSCSLQTQEERHITHMQYLAWPDHGVPDDSTEFLNFVTQVRKARVGMVEPTIVHCSAGIGRTGVLILMETAQCLIEANEPIYPLDIVKAMRDQRAMMIQTASQFRFVCEAIHRVYTEELVKPLAEYQQR